MKITDLNRGPAQFRLGILTSAIITALGSGYSHTTHAQAGAEDEETGQAEEIIVTGSRILRRDYEANSPIMTVDEEFFENTSTIGVETIMNQLPQFVPAVTQFDTVEVQSTATTTPGSSTISLRGLGSNRNLVLLDGRRAMPVNASGAVDINMVPSSAIERVETITGGASSVYGADAMAGVVNFILKDDYEGFELDLQGGITEQGDGETQRLNALWGANLEDGGNVMLGFEYSEREEVYQADRDFYTDGWSDPSVAGTEFRLSDNGFLADALNAPDPDVVNDIFGSSVSNIGSFYFNEDGSIYRQTADGADRYNGPMETEDGTWRKELDDGSLAENQLNSMISIPLERYSFFGRAHFDINENTSAFFQATMSQNKNSTLLLYSPATGSWSADIPYGNDTYEDSLDEDGVTTRPEYQNGGIYGLDCPATGGCTESQAFPVPPELAELLDSRPDPEASWSLEHVLDYLGPRRTENKVNSYQMVFGFEGDAPISDWTWEAYASYGNTSTTTQLLGFTSLESYRDIVTSPNFGQGYFETGNEQGDGFGGGLGECTSGLPVIDYFTPTQDCLDALTVDMQNQSDMVQQVVEANIQGHLADLPAGEMRFAAGASYRKNDYAYLTDTLTSQNSFLDSAVGLFPASNTSGSTSTKEVYGELLIPVLADMPFVQELNIEAGYRYSDNDPSPAADTYKVLFDWTVNDQIRFRGGRQIATRAPNIGELFLSRTQTLEVTYDGDYCSTRNPFNPFSANPGVNSSAAEVQALCSALMGATAAANYYSDPENQSDASYAFSFINLVGNPELDNETAETYTLGGVFSITDNLTLTADWYDIEITDMISAQTASSVYLECLNPETNPTYDPNHPACQNIVRDPVTGFIAPTDVSYSNDARVETAGLDVQMNWGTDAFNGGVNVNFMVNYLHRYETQVNESAESIDWVGTFGPTDLTGVNGGAYDYRTFTTLSYFDNRGWNMSLRWRYLPEIDSAGAATGTTTTATTADYNIFDFSGGYRFGHNDHYLLRYGIDNLFDTAPEITQKNTDPEDPSSGAGSTDSSFYDVLGRRYYVGFNMRF